MASAQAVALAVYWAKHGLQAAEIQRRLVARFDYPLNLAPDDIRPGYKRTERASESVPEVISCALHAVSYEDAICNAVSLGGDSDTIAAIAGGIAGALFRIPEKIKTEAVGYLPNDIKAVIARLIPTKEKSPQLSPVEGFYSL